VEEDSVGLYSAGIPATFAIGAGESTEIIGGYQTRPPDRSTFRGNFGLVEVTGSGTCSVRVRALDSSGAAVATQTYTVRQWEQVQLSVKTAFPSLSSKNFRLRVRVLSGSGRVIAFASNTANGSQDSYLLEMEYRPELLADSLTDGTISGVTAGDGLTGGGSSGTVSLHVGQGAGISVGADAVSLANGGVTKNKLAASGGTNDQVLGTDGTSLRWQSPQGLNLPIEAEITQTNPAFSITHGFGDAISAQSMGGTHGGIRASGQSYGVWASSPFYGISASGGYAGVFATCTGDNYGVRGEAQSSSGGIGVLGQSRVSHGVQGVSTSGNGVTGESSSGHGVYATSTSGVAMRVVGNTNTAVWATTTSGFAAVDARGGSAIGVYATSSSSLAGRFDGNVVVSGTLTKAGSFSKLDHPLDPERMYLTQATVESPDMKTVYDGVVVLDEQGAAWVELPPWCEILNRDFRYQLTAIGAPGPSLYIHSKIKNNRFNIAGGPPGIEVSWQVTGIRQDPWANGHRLPLEMEKERVEVPDLPRAR